MKKEILVSGGFMKNWILMFMFIIAFSLFGTIYHVNNNNGVISDFTSLSSAHSGVNAGDTLYVYGSVDDYGSLTISKPLYIIGPGYFLSENEDTQQVKQNATVSTITINSGGEGTTITGLDMDRIQINTDDVIIKRNYIYNTSSYYDAVSINSYVQNIQILQNYIKTTGSSSKGISLNSDSMQIIISNNIIYHSYYNYYALTMYSSAQAIIYNNVLHGAVTLYNADFYNNILVDGNFYANTAVSYYNNIGNEDQFSPCGDNGNYCNVAMSSVFKNTGSTDGKWQLETGSPAIGAGFSGEDCGAFGGISSYKLSGIPSEIPAIYYFHAPGAGFEIPVEIKAKSHD